MDEFSSSEVLDQAKANAQAAFLVTIGYLKEEEGSPDGYWRFVGEKFTLGWDPLKDKGAREALRMFALNMVSVGATLESFSGDESRAEAVFTGWPSPDLMEAFGISQEDVDRMYAVFQPIAEFLDLRYEWRSQGDRATLILSQ